MKKIVIILLILLLSVIATASVFNTTDETDFNTGTYNQTFYNGTFTQLNSTRGGFTSGTYRSQVFNATGYANWQNITWQSYSTGELPDGAKTENFFAGNSNMTNIYALYHFNSGGGSVTDSSGQANDGTFMGGGSFSGSPKLGALSGLFDQAGDYVNITDPVGFSGTDMTIIAWVYIDSTGGSNRKILLGREDTSRGQDITVGISASNFYFATYGTCFGNVDVSTSSGISTATWYNVAFVLDSGNKKTIYINGANDSSSTTTTSIGNCAQNTMLGATANNTGAENWDGNIDELAIYQRALNDTEIMDIYTRGATRLNATVRTCDDDACSGETFSNIGTNSSVNLSVLDNQYFQYEFLFSSDTNSTTPKLQNVSIGYTLTNYTLIDCGTLTSPGVYNLTTNVSSTGTCFDIDASNITLECQGNNITYATSANGYAIDSRGYSNNRFSDCKINKNRSTSNSDYGITISGENITIENNSINTQGGTGSYAINLLNVANGKIANNTITTNGSTTSYGILFSGTNQTRVYNNSITTNGTGSNNNGIHVSVTSNNNNITNNYIRAYGKGNTQYGIHLLTTAQTWVITNNTITSTGDGTFNAGIQVTTNDNHIISNNVITTDGTGQDYGITMSSSSTGSLYESNVITAQGTGNRNDGFHLQGTSNRLVNNNITATTNGVTLNDTTSGGNNKLIYNNSFGQINWSAGKLTTNISLIIGNDIFMTNGTVGLTDDTENRFLDAAARIELRQLNDIVTTPFLLKDNVRCDNTNACNITWDNTTKILYANISSFSNYTTFSPSITSCVDITTSGIFTLLNNVDSSGTCFNITSNDVSLDCTNYNITYGTSQAGAGITTSGYDNITITNCMLLKGSSWQANNYGINFTGSDNDTIINNTIINDGTSSNYGLYLINSYGGNISNNSITTNGTTSNFGMWIDSSNYTTISGNKIVTNGSGGSNHGIRFDNSLSSNITHNNIETNGSANNIGLAFFTSTTMIVYNNTILAKNAAASSPHGALYLTVTNYSNISRNTITKNGVGDSYGIHIYSNANYNVIENNTVVSSGTSDSNYGIYVVSSSIYNNVTNNNILTNGTSSNHGLFINTKSNNTFVNDNNITAQGTTSSNYGVYLSSSADVTLLNNNISSTSFQDYDLFDDTGANSPNFLIYNNSLGEIRWTNTTAGYISDFLENLTLNISNSDGIGLGRNLFIGNNTAALNTTAFTSGLTASPLINSSANITLYTLNNWSSLNGIKFLQNYSTSSSEIREKGANCTNCYIDSFSGGTLKFNVSSFSSYAGDNVTVYPSCGDINSNITLTQSINSAGTCFTVTASDVTLDCDNYTIKYATSSSGYGINNSGGYKNITIQECNIMGGTVSSANNYAIYFNNSFGNIIQHNSLYPNGTNDNYGIYFDGLTNSSIINNNTIITTGTGTENMGVFINNSNNHNITNNLIKTNGTLQNYGIAFFSSANSSRIINNSIYTNGTSTNNNGIYFYNKASWNNISNNSIYTNGTSDNVGILFSTNVDENIVDRNTITTFGTAGSNVGIILSTSTNKNNITENIIITNGSSSNYGINLEISSNNTLIFNNIINATGRSGSSNYGIYLNDRVAWNNISNNSVYTNAVQNNKGIYLLTNADHNIIFSNSIETFGTSTNNFGIQISTTSDNNNVTENIITTNGSSTNYGISLDTSANTTLIVDNNITTSATNGGNGRGISVEDRVSGVNIINNTITTNGTSLNIGIALVTTVSNTLIANNTITTNGRTTRNDGIALSTGTNNNNISGNTILTNGSNTNYGLSLASSSNNTLITTNNITARGTGNSNYAVYIERSSRNILLNNNLTSRSSQDYPIFDESNTGGIANTLIYNNSFGQINWTLTNLTTNITPRIGSTIFIENNLVGLTNDTQALNLDGQAKIDILGLTYGVVSVQLLKDGVRCDDNIALCNRTYDGSAGTLSADVSSFSNYTTSVLNAAPNTGGGSGGSGGGSTITTGNTTLDTVWGYSTGDGICHYSLGETKLVSPDDCKYRLENYALCLKDRRMCLSIDMFYYIIATLLIVGLLLVNQLTNKT